MSDSGAPKHWPFHVVEPGDFKIPERAVSEIRFTTFDKATKLKQELAEELNDIYVQQGWMGIGYHYVIDKEGSIVTGRALDEIPICGDISEKTNAIAIAAAASEKATVSRQMLCLAILDKYRLVNKNIEVRNV